MFYMKYVSLPPPKKKWGVILFLAQLQVCCLSLYHTFVFAQYLEPLVGFTNNYAQMSSMISRCAVYMFDQGQFKVKVKIQG